MAKIKNTFNKLTCRLNVVKDRISETEDLSVEIIHTEMQGEKIKRQTHRIKYPRTGE